VHDYGDICQAITELAVELNAPVSTDDFRTLNRCLDEAIAGAVTQYTRERNESAIDGEPARGGERLGFFTHESRNLTNTAIVAFEVLKTGNVGVAGSTGAVLHRSLTGLRALIGRSLAEVRLTQGVQNREQMLVSAFVDEVASAATLDADARGITLIVLPVEDGVTIEADRQILVAVVGNLLQNAFKFTRPQTAVTLRVGASTDRVQIEIEDECGGLPGWKRPRTVPVVRAAKRGSNRLGSWPRLQPMGAEANNGRIYTRNLPDQGCVFTVDLPRFPVPALA
jgi:signal transduction histidine kinase